MKDNKGTQMQKGKNVKRKKNDEEKTLSNSEFAIGAHVKLVLAEQGRTVTWLAGQMGCSREYLYKLFNRTWMSTDLLVKISEAMRHDFFKDYSRTLKFKRTRN